MMFSWSICLLFFISCISGIMHGVRHIQMVKSGEIPPAPITKDRSVYIFLDI